MMHDKQKQIMYIVGEIPKYLVMGKRSVYKSLLMLNNSN